MLNKFSEKMKKGIGTVSLAFFLCSSMSFVHINWAEAAPPPPPPNQTEKKPPPPKKPAPKPNVNRPKPPAHKPTPRPNVNRPKPPAHKPAPRPNVNRPKPPAHKPTPRPNVNRPKPQVNKPARPNVNRPKPQVNKPARPNINRPKPNNNFKPPMTKPATKPNNNFKPPITKPGNGFKPPTVKPPKPDIKPPKGPRPNIKPTKPGDGFKPPAVKPPKPNMHNQKGPKPDIKPPKGPRPDIKPTKPGDGFKPPTVKPPKPNMHNQKGPKPDIKPPKGPRPNVKPPRKPSKKFTVLPAPPSITLVSREAPPPPPSDYEYEDDKPSVWERILTGIFMERMSFAKDNAALTAELNDMGFACAGLDLEYPDKYVQIYCNSYDGANDAHIDYYLDKTSLKVLNYNPPFYTIKVNEYSTDTSKPMDRQMNTWEFRYNLNAHTVTFTNLYGDYHSKYKNSNRMDTMNVYALEPDIAAMAEMAFYMAYNMRFFNNQADSFYDVETL